MVSVPLLSCLDYISCAGHGLITLIGLSLTTMHYNRGTGIYVLALMAFDTSFGALNQTQRRFNWTEVMQPGTIAFFVWR